MSSIPISGCVGEICKSTTLIGYSNVVKTICACVAHLMERVGCESHLREVRVDVACRISLQMYSSFKATCKRIICRACTTSRYASCFWRIHEVTAIVILLEVLSCARTSKTVLRIPWRHEIVGLDTVATEGSIINMVPIVPCLLLGKLTLIAILPFFHVLMI